MKKANTKKDFKKFSQRNVHKRRSKDAAVKALARALADVNGGMLIISNFTLCADYRKGNRPDFFAAASPDQAKKLYDLFCQKMKEKNPRVGCGIFGADMKIEAHCDGPVTLTMDSRVLRRVREP